MKTAAGIIYSGLMIIFAGLHAQTPALKGNNHLPGEIFWEEHFDSVDWKASVSPYNPAMYSGNLLADSSLMPNGWSVYDATGNNFHWHWSVLGPRGRYTSYISPDLMTSLVPTTNPLHNLASETCNNGVMMLELDYFNTLPNGMMNPNYIQLDSYIVTPAIDLSESSFILLRFSEKFRWCCSGQNKISVYVSNDYDTNNPSGAHWTEYSAKGGFPLDGPTVNPFIITINITESAAGQGNVRLMWRMTGASHYYWIIDDVYLEQPPQYDLVIQNTWADYLFMPPTGIGVDPDNDWFGGYTQIPRNIVGNFVQFRAAVKNNGSQIQNNVILNTRIERNGLMVYSQQSTPINSLPAAFEDTCKITTPFTPDRIGAYKIIFHVSSNQPDVLPLNNSDTLRFEVTDHTYSRVSHNIENYATFSCFVFWNSLSTEGSRLAVLYDFPETRQNIKIKSLTTFIPLRNDSAMIAAGQFEIVGRLFGLDEEGQIVNTPLASTNRYTLTEADRGNFLTLDFADEGNLEIPSSSSYYAALEFYTGDGYDNNEFYIVEDSTVKFPSCMTNMIYFSEAGWIQLNTNCMIDLNLAYSNLSVVTINLNIKHLINLFFNPEIDYIFITGEFNQFGHPPDTMIKISDTIYSITRIFEKDICYTAWFHINSPYIYVFPIDFTFYPQSDTCVFNLMWTFGDIDDIKPEKQNIFPNPVKNQLTISGKTLIKHVTFYDFTGQRVYDTDANTLTFSMNIIGLKNGVYFVAVTDVAGNKTSLKFIKTE